MVLNIGDIIIDDSCMAKSLSWEPFQDLKVHFTTPTMRDICAKISNWSPTEGNSSSLVHILIMHHSLCKIRGHHFKRCLEIQGPCVDTQVISFNFLKSCTKNITPFKNWAIVCMN
jgi:hypothetical protein